MDAAFWHARWGAGEIGFHEAEANALLVQAEGRFRPGQRVFVPLCGKTRDIAWFLDRGLSVVGVELSRIAVEDLFGELGVAPEVSEVGALTLYQTKGLDVFVGDVFDLTAERLGPVDVTYDRAAMVALPDGMRARYADHLRTITGRAPILLITFDYAQAEMAGPPFSVPVETVRALHGGHYALSELTRWWVPGRLKGRVEAEEILLWLERA